MTRPAPPLAARDMRPGPAAWSGALVGYDLSCSRPGATRVLLVILLALTLPEHQMCCCRLADGRRSGRSRPASRQNGWLYVPNPLKAPSTTPQSSI